MKFSFFVLIIIQIIIFKKFIKYNYFNINQKYLYFQKNIDSIFKNKLNNKIKIGIFTYNLSGGGLQRITSLLLNYLDAVNFFELYLFSLKINESEYLIPDKIKRVYLNNCNISNLIIETKKKQINILIYQFHDSYDIKFLNSLNKIKVIYYLHNSIFFWIHSDFNKIKTTYKEYINSNYIINLVPIENDYIFTKWGINSILMNNFISYEYNSIKQSNLDLKIIIMLGRADSKYKRFFIGIQSMPYISKEIPKCEMKIISKENKTEFLKYLINNLQMENNIKFVGFNKNPDIYFKNASIHIFPTLSESFALALCETKIFGIPNILLGLDYVSASNGGTIIIYDETPESLAKEALKILQNNNYRKKLGYKARLSMKKYNNKLLLKKWIKLLLSIYNGDIYYKKLLNKQKINLEKKYLKILKKQIILIKKRRPKFENTTIYDFLNFSFILNFNNS